MATTELDPAERGVKYIVVMTERQRHMILSGLYWSKIKGQGKDIDTLIAAMRDLQSCAVSPEVNDISKILGA